MKTTGQSFTILSCLSLTQLVALKTIRAQKNNRKTLARWTIYTFICTVWIRFCPQPRGSFHGWFTAKVPPQWTVGMWSVGDHLCVRFWKVDPSHLRMFEPCGGLIRERNITTNLPLCTIQKNRYFCVKLLLSRILVLLCFLWRWLAFNTLHSLAVAVHAHQLSSGRFFFIIQYLNCILVGNEVSHSVETISW
jgi:hypothetical protein